MKGSIRLVLAILLLAATTLVRSQSIDDLLTSLTASPSASNSEARVEAAAMLVTTSRHAIANRNFDVVDELILHPQLETVLATLAGSSYFDNQSAYLSWLELINDNLPGAQTSQVAQLFRVVGDALLSVGAESAAMDRYARGIEIARALGDSALQQQLERKRIPLYLAAGELQQAQLSYQAIQSVLEDSDLDQLAEVQVERVKLLARLFRGGESQLVAAMEGLNTTLESLDSLDPAAATTFRLQAAGAVISQAPAAVAVLENSLQNYLDNAAAAMTSNREQAFIAGYRGGLALARLNAATAENRAALIEEALQYSRRGLRLAVEENLDEQIYRWQHQLARIHRLAGQTARALDNYQAAVNSLARLQSLVSFMPLVSLQDHVYPLYNEYQELLAQSALGSTDPAVRQARVQQIQSLFEARNRTDILEYFSGNCLFPPEFMTLEDIQPGTAVLYPLALDEELVPVIAFSDGVQLFDPVPVTAAELAAQANALRLAIAEDYLANATPGSNPAAQPLSVDALANELYGWLIAPVHEALVANQVSKLVFVSTPELRAVPWAALKNQERYLVEEFAVVSSLGLQLTDSRFVAGGGNVFLGGVTEEIQARLTPPGFVALPHVEQELESIRTILGGTPKLNAGFQLQDLVAELSVGNYSVAHLATHASFQGDAASSYILAFDQKFRMERLQESVGTRRFVDRPLDLLVLSACETAVGSEKAVLGLAGVSLKAGARSTLASLWKVVDSSTAELMGHFYRALESGVGKAESLQVAQQQMIAEGNHPYLWSAFSLIGNWQ